LARLDHADDIQAARKQAAPAAEDIPQAAADSVAKHRRADLPVCSHTQARPGKPVVGHINHHSFVTGSALPGENLAKVHILSNAIAGLEGFIRRHWYAQGVVRV